MTYQCFDLKVENQIAHISMNRPEKTKQHDSQFLGRIARTSQGD